MIGGPGVDSSWQFISSTRRRSRSFFFSSRRRHTSCLSDWSSDVCSSDLAMSASGGYGKGQIAAGIIGTVDPRIGDAAADVLDAQIAAGGGRFRGIRRGAFWQDRKSTRLNSSHLGISYAVFCLKKKKKTKR